MAFLYKVRLLLLALIAVACVALWPGVQAALVVDNDLSAWFLTDDPALVLYHDFQGRFGNDEVVVVVVRDARTVLTLGHFTGLRALSAELAGLPEVAQMLGAGTAELPGRAGLLGTAAPWALWGWPTYLTLVLLAGTPRLRNDTYTLGYLPDDYVVVTDHQAMEAAWGTNIP